MNASRFALVRTMDRVMRLIDLRGTSSRPDLARNAVDGAAVEAIVRPILADVAERGEAAVLDWAERFEGFRPAMLRVPAEVLASCEQAMDPKLRAALTIMIDRVRRVHEVQIPVEQVVEVAPGANVEQRWIPVDRVGLYVPGGGASYVSSVVMNVVPAQLAGVRSVAVVSPPQPDHDGLPNPAVLGAAALLGVSEFYAVGGAQAIAMLAYGSGPGEAGCLPVSMVTGPGNTYVTAAKRLLRDLIAIDAEAGPTEVLVLADETADAECIAADLVSQAEHDALAAAVLVTTSAKLADRVSVALPRRIAEAQHEDRIRASLAGHQSAIVLVSSLDHAVDIANEYAAEHLEIQTADAEAVSRRIRNAGAVFVGRYSPVALGDYLAGSNHVLPTAGSARCSAGLSVGTFLKGVQVINYNRQALEEIAEPAAVLAMAERLPAHRDAIRARLDGG